MFKSYCTYNAFGETGDDPNIDPVYPNPDANGYQGMWTVMSEYTSTTLTYNRYASMWNLQAHERH
jgi:hypothetical protein